MKIIKKLNVNEKTVEDKTLNNIIDSVGDAVITTDIKGRIVRINPTAEKLTGWNSNLCHDKDLPDIFKIFNTKTMEIIDDPVVKVQKSGQMGTA